MKYGKIVEGKFIDRPNRFIAHVEIAGKAETVHVKNTGRCRELLLPGAAVRLEQSDNPARKTLYDLVAVYKDRIGWINIDSQAPNKVVKEWLEAQDYDVVRPEYTYGNSRIDFYLEKGEHKILMEVKGCTLEINGIGYFPDAPTERGVKHLRELAAARQEGYECVVAFVIQMEGVTEVRPYVEMQPEFGTALAEAEAAGVKVLFLPCKVGRDWLKIDGKLRVAHCGGFYLRDIVEEKCRLRPACRKLPGLNRGKTRITPRLSETSGAQQRKDVNYRAFRNVGYNKCRDVHRGRMFRLLWTFVDLKLPSAMSHAIHKIVSIKRCQSYFISRRSPHLGISKDSELCASAHRCLHYAYARLIARVTFYLVVQSHVFQFRKQIPYRLSA